METEVSIHHLKIDLHLNPGEGAVAPLNYFQIVPTGVAWVGYTPLEWKR